MVTYIWVDELENMVFSGVQNPAGNKLARFPPLYLTLLAEVVCFTQAYSCLPFSSHLIQHKRLEPCHPSYKVRALAWGVSKRIMSDSESEVSSLTWHNIKISSCTQSSLHSGCLDCVEKDWRPNPAQEVSSGWISCINHWFPTPRMLPISYPDPNHSSSKHSLSN